MLELVRALSDRFQHTQNPDDLDRQIDLSEKALSALHEGHEARPCALRFLGNALRHRTPLKNDRNDVDRAMVCHENLRDMFYATPDQPSWMIGELALSLKVKAEFFMDDRDNSYDQAIHLFREALTSSMSNDYELGILRGGLASTLHARYFSQGSPGDLQEGNHMARVALALRPPGHRDRASALRTLGNGLFAWAERSHEISDLEEAIRILEEALNLSSRSILIMNSLADALTMRFDLNGASEDLERAANIFKDAISICEEHSAYLPVLLNNYSLTLNQQWLTNHTLETLESCLHARRRCLSLIDIHNSRWRYTVAHNLAVILLSRFELYGDRENLDEAHALLIECLADSHHNSPDRAYWLHTLARLYKLRFLQLEDTHALFQSVGACEESIRHIILSDYRQKHYYTQAAYIHGLLFKHTGMTHLASLERAIKYWTKALECCPPGELQRTSCLTGLASAYADRFRLLHQHDDAKRAMLHQQEGVTISAKQNGSVRAAFGMANLYLLDGSEYYSIEKALELVLLTMRHAEAYPQHRLDEVVDFLEELSGKQHLQKMSAAQSTELLRVYELAIDDLPKCAFHGMHSRGQLFVLRPTDLLALGAAQQALFLDQPERAIECLEQGRAVFWSQYVRLRIHHITNHGSDDVLHDLSRVAQMLQSAYKEDSETDRSAKEAQAGRQRQLGAQFDRLVAEARTVPGFERLLLPETFSSLNQAAEKYPVVVLVAGFRACSAIVLMPGRTSAIAIHLESVNRAQLETLIKQLSLGNTSVRGQSTRSRAIQVRRRKGDPEGTPSVLQELWKVVMKPVFRVVELKACLSADL